MSQGYGPAMSWLWLCINSTNNMRTNIRAKWLGVCGDKNNDDHTLMTSEGWSPSILVTFRVYIIYSYKSKSTYGKGMLYAGWVTLDFWIMCPDGLRDSWEVQTLGGRNGRCDGSNGQTRGERRPKGSSSILISIFLFGQPLDTACIGSTPTTM